MTTKTVSVGDVVAWDDVPSGAMVRDDDGDIAMNIDGMGSWVKGPTTGNRVFGWRPDFKWEDASIGFENDERIIVIATMLTGDEAGVDLQSMAERFERDHPQFRLRF